MVLGTQENDRFVLIFGLNKTERSTEVALVGIKVDKQLKWKSHIEELCKKVFALQFVYNRYDKSYHDLLSFSSAVSLHQRHLRFLF